MKEFTHDELEKLDKEAIINLFLALQSNQAKILQQLNVLTEQIMIMNQRAFGKKSERNVIDGQISLFDGSYDPELIFNEAEVGYDNSKEPDIEEIVVHAHSRKKKSSGRDAKFEGVPARIYECTLTEEELAEKFPDGYKELPIKTCKLLSIIPQTFIVDEYHIHTYASVKNDGIIAHAKYPDRIFTTSFVTPSLIAATINGKFVNHQPFERQIKEFKNHGVELGSNTLCNWAIRGSEDYLSKIYDKLHEILYDSKVIHADETTVRVVDKNKPSNSKNYMWVYCNDTDAVKNPIIIYDYGRTRKADHPREFLKSFSGVVVTDGYQVYHTLDGERDDLTVAGCWVHAKRKFAEITKSIGISGVTGTIAKQAEDRITCIFQEDKQLKHFGKMEREKRRERNVKPKVDTFFAWAHELVESGQVQGKVADALQYCLNQEQYLRVFLKNGNVPMDNNAAERAIRPFTLGRKNWMLIASERGANASAIIYSIVETAKANNLKVYDYLELLFTEMPKHKADENDDYLYSLLPWNKAVQKKCHVPK